MAFKIRIHGEKKVRDLDVKTTIYRDAAAAVPAILGLHLPVDVEIWFEKVIPEYGPYHYRIRENEFGGLVVEHLVPIDPHDTQPNTSGPISECRGRSSARFR